MTFSSAAETREYVEQVMREKFPEDFLMNDQ
jgi:hypothetical protein